MSELYNDLIKLSNILKKGFTIEIKNNTINQYTFNNKPYISSYKTLITINLKNNQITFNHVYNKLQDCIIGGYYDKTDNTFKIELCKAFKFLSECVKFAYIHKQKSIYDLRFNKEYPLKAYNKYINSYLSNKEL